MPAFTPLRPLLRSAPRLAAFRAGPAFRSRAYTTEAPAAAAKSSNGLLFGGIAAVLLGAYYAFSDSATDPTKVKVAASPQQVDYQA